MVIKPQNPAYASLVHYYWAKYLEALLDRLADKVIAGEPPNRKEYEQMRWLYRRLKGGRRCRSVGLCVQHKI